MKALDNILTRTSSSILKAPCPSEEEMNLVYKAALRAPDHKWLRPSRFIQITGEGLDKLSDIFFNFGKNHVKNISKEKLKKYKSIPAIAATPIYINITTFVSSFIITIS